MKRKKKKKTAQHFTANSLSHFSFFLNVNINAYCNDCKYIKVKMTYSFSDDMS